MTASPVEIRTSGLTVLDARHQLAVLDDLVTAAAISFASATVAGREDAAAAALAHFVDFSTKYQTLLSSLTPTLRVVL